MAQKTYAVGSLEYGCNGTLALKPQRSGLRVIEGGLGKSEVAQAVTGSHKAKAASKARPRALLALAFVAAAVVLSTMLAGALVGARTSSALEAAPTHQVTVHTGDTVWSIADQSHVGGVSTQDVKRWIIERNGISNSLIAPGQTLVVPGE